MGMDHLTSWLIWTYLNPFRKRTTFWLSSGLSAFKGQQRTHLKSTSNPSQPTITRNVFTNALQSENSHRSEKLILLVCGVLGMSFTWGHCQIELLKCSEQTQHLTKTQCCAQPVNNEGPEIVDVIIFLRRWHKNIENKNHASCKYQNLFQNDENGITQSNGEACWDGARCCLARWLAVRRTCCWHLIKKASLLL